MTAGRFAMLLGLFLVPLMLLWAGHRMRRRSALWRSAFWGAATAHLIVTPIVLVAAMMPAADWSAADRWRGFFGLWAMLVAPVLGAVVGALLQGSRDTSRR